MIDLADSLDLPIVLVARSTLGTINHTLLSLEAIRRRGLPLAGVIISGPETPHNRAAIERFGQGRSDRGDPLPRDHQPRDVEGSFSGTRPPETCNGETVNEHSKPTENTVRRRHHRAR